AFDTTKNDWTWQIPGKSTDRTAPSVTAVWHGRLYGRVGDRVVMLDLATGRDLLPAPSLAPSEVNVYFGLVRDVDGKLKAFPTIG
ncbi:MAG: hypothetical protein QG608_2800, partial [Actinomycetota bacterium]|nr:hypothetical protein [Actinomycetota bacterium]